MSSSQSSLRSALSREGGVRRRLAAAESELAIAELRYRGIVEQIPAVVYEAECDARATLRYVSPQIEAMLGHRVDEYMTDDELWYRNIHADDHDRVLETERIAYENGHEFECEYRVNTPDGRTVHLWERDSIVRDAAGRPLFAQGILFDVTALREAEITARAERDQAQSYIDAASGLFLILRAGGTVGVLNRAGHEALGHEPGELIGRDWFDIALPDDDRERQRAAFDDVMTGVRAEPFLSYENQVRRRDGSTMTVAWHTTMTRDDEGRPTAMLCSGTDVSEHREAERRVAYLASHDSVTGLANLVLLGEHLEGALARARRNRDSVALMCLGFDDFALVNDSLGHAAGDELLVQIAARLGARLRASDVLARKEAAEFMVLLADLDGDVAEQARATADALRGTLSDAFEIAGTEFHLDVSIGISLYGADATGTEQLMRHADTAMHRARTAGGDGIAVYSHNGERPLERLSMSTRLRRAIERDELVLDWQPIVDPRTGVLRRAEALVRWQDPLRGLVGPGDFIPFAECSGLIERVGDWVAEHVMLQCAKWTAMDLDPEVAFNVSARELRGPGYATRLLERLQRHGLDPRRIVVEVTESVAMNEDGAGDTALRELADASVNVAIDDFGAGWSSLGRLRELPVKMLKIDRSFLRGVPDDPGATAVVRAILELATALGMETVAEGVETPAQRAFLVDRDCPLAQGYLLNRPMPAAAMESELRRAAALRRGPRAA